MKIDRNVDVELGSHALDGLFVGEVDDLEVTEHSAMVRKDLVQFHSP
jgi:hypothetical protein